MLFFKHIKRIAEIVCRFDHYKSLKTRILNKSNKIFGTPHLVLENIGITTPLPL